jgi:hypothetical protein
MTVTTHTTSFEALLADLRTMGTMAKAIDVNQERIDAGRSAEGHMQSGDTMTKSEIEKKKKEEEEEEKRKKEEKERMEKAGHRGSKEEHEMTKSFSLQTADGKTIEVQDAGDLLKALGARLDTTESTILATITGAAEVIRSQGDLLKSLSDKLFAQDKLLGEQATLIKSLQNDVTKLGHAPAGRRAVLAVAEREAAPSTAVLAKSGIPEGVTPDAFFAKALEKQGQGKVTGFEISLAENMLAKGMPLSEALIQRVLS